MNAKSTLVQTPKVRSAVAAVLPLLKKYRIFVLENDDQLNPTRAIESLRREVSRADSPEAAQAALKRIAELNSPAASELRHVIRKSASFLWREAKAAILVALDAALNEAKAGQQDAIKAEAAFFAEHGLPREATSVSRAWNSVTERIEASAASLRDPQAYGSAGVPNPAGHTSLEILGIQL